MNHVERLKRVKQIYSVFSICLILFGMFLLLKPSMASEVFCKICGGLLLLFGITKLFGYFSGDLLQLAFQFDFAMGIISCFIGFVMLFWSKQLMEALIVGIGLFMLADALLRVQTALDAKKVGVKHWWGILIIALITAVIGTLLFLKPYNGLDGVVILIGFNLMIDGILNLFVVQSTVNTIKRKTEWDENSFLL